VKPVLFDDSVVIYTSLDLMTGARAKFSYRMETPEGDLVATGESEHCFLDEKTRVPINLRKRWPEAFKVTL
jgi:acyl-CoA thioester hydrolase